MRRPLTTLLLLATCALLVAACAASEAPGWTYAPPTEAPASQAAPSGGASGAPSTAPSAGASAAPSEAASGGAGGDIVQISAQGTAFEQADVTVPAGKAFTIHFNNKDAGMPHNVAIKDASGMEMFKGEIITGPKEIDYQVPALAAGSYQFVCTVHPNMVGTMKAGG